MGDSVVIFLYSYVSFVVLYILLIAASFLKRAFSGINFKKVISNKFHGLISVRIVLFLIFILMGLFGLITSVYCANLFINGSEGLGVLVKILCIAVYALVFTGIVLLCYRFLIHTTHPVPDLELENLQIDYGITDREIRELTAKEPEYRVFKIFNWLLGIAGLIYFAVFFNMLFTGEEVFSIPSMIMESFAFQEDLPRMLLYNVFIFMLCLNVILLFINRKIFTVPWKFFIRLACLGVLFLVISLLGVSLGNGIFMVSIFLLLFAVAEAVTAVKKSIAESKNMPLETIESEMDKIVDAQTALSFKESPPVLPNAELSKRIIDGLGKIEHSSVFIKRSFTDYCRIVDINYTDIFAHRIAHLYVVRYTLTGRRVGPTMEHNRHPLVQVWEYELMPPDGYTAKSDRYELPDEYNTVDTCLDCNGTGWVTKDVSHTEYKNETVWEDGVSKTKSVPVTVHESRRERCSDCGGMGHIEYKQVLATDWRSVAPFCPDPEIDNKDLVRNSFEDVLYEWSFTEAGAVTGRVMKANELLKIDDAQLIELGNKFKELSDRHQEGLVSGMITKGNPDCCRLYRSGYQIVSQKLIKLHFTKLGKYNVGYFFGNTPEFHFRKLPVSLEALFAFPLMAVILIRSSYLIAMGFEPIFKFQDMLYDAVI